jgi:hypothetical protein
MPLSFVNSDTGETSDIDDLVTEAIQRACDASPDKYASVIDWISQSTTAMFEKVQSDFPSDEEKATEAQAQANIEEAGALQAKIRGDRRARSTPVARPIIVPNPPIKVT